MGQWIFGKASPVSLSDKGKQLLKSSNCIVSDFVGEHGSPSNGILCTFKSVPVAFWDVPTLNQMVFSRKLWECLLDNQYLKQSMENGSHWGEAKHADRDEVYLDEVACRVNNFWIGDNNIVYGDVDIPNTPKGNIVYSLAKISRVGISSRGFGELRDMNKGLKEVIPDQYMHVCWDMVAFPAVPDAHMTLVTGDSIYDETISMSTELRKLIEEAYKRNPNDKALQQLVSNGRVGISKSAVPSRLSLETATLSHAIKKLQSKRYTPLYSGNRSGIMSMAGTRSIIEEFERLLCSAFPDKRWELKEAKPLDDGWYKVSYLSIDKSKINYNIKFDRRIFMVRKSSSTTWDIKEFV